MPLSQEHIGPQTPMGANLVADGATFRVWAPGARQVHLRLNAGADWIAADANVLVKDAHGSWGGFVPGVQDGDRYRFFVVGAGSTGVNRDPQSYPWHDQGFQPPAFHDLIIYQLHIGTFYAVDAEGQDRRAPAGAKFL